MSLRKKMFEARKELEAATGLKVGCCLYPVQFKHKKRPLVMFCVHEIDYCLGASWLGAGVTAKEAKKDFLKTLDEYRNSEIPHLLLCETAGPQYLPATR